MHNQLQKAITLAKKTGDRLIVVDRINAEEIFVVMSLDEYEKLVIGRSEVRNLTEDELLDKINRDIAIWKSENERNEEKADFQSSYYKELYLDKAEPNLKSVIDDDIIDDDMYYYNENEPNLLGRLDLSKGDFKKEEGGDESESNAWRIPTEIKRGAEEIVEDIEF